MRIKTRTLLPLVMALFSVAAFAQHHIANAEVTAMIQDKLYHAQVFKHGEVKVAFNSGTATLTGSVDCIGVKWDATRAVRKVDDVDQVVNNITVNTDDVTDQQIVAQARKDILTYYAYTIFDWVSLETQGHRLTMKGYVTQPYMKQDIAYFLAHIKGVSDLTNDLQVLPVSGFDTDLRIDIARAIYNDPYFVYYAIQAIPPIHIIVDNGNVTLDGVVATRMDREKAAADAQTAATFFKFTDNLVVEHP